MINQTHIIINHDDGSVHTDFGTQAGEMVRALIPVLFAAATADRREHLMDAPVCPDPAHAARAAHP